VTILVLLVLAIVWAIVLLPPVLRARAEGRPADSIGHFRTQLRTLQRTGPIAHHRSNRTARPAEVTGFLMGPAHAPAVRPAPVRSPGVTRARKRRRDILVGLLAAVVISLVLGLVPGLHILLLVHVLADVLLASYVAMLVRMRNAVAEREMKLRFLPGSAAHVEPALLLRRSAN
jgi:hypothetical protein